MMPRLKHQIYIVQIWHDFAFADKYHIFGCKLRLVVLERQPMMIFFFNLSVTSVTNKYTAWDSVNLT